ncbi:AAA family ATPase [Chroococcidiopsis sp.]|uniref:AAA family ATPase n=1 Tax=Chroococcidiopsis sp. TaxID=3088168 RepID=UPI003F2E0A34
MIPNVDRLEYGAPHNTEAEIALIGALLFDTAAFAQIGDLEPEHFYHNNHQLIFTAIKDLAARSQPTDLVFVTNYLREKTWLKTVGGKTALAKICQQCVTSINVAAYAVEIKAHWERRELIRQGEELIQSARDEFRAVAEPVKKSTKAARATSVKLSFEQLLSKVDEMFELYEDDPARFEYELWQMHLESGMPVSKIRALHRLHKEGKKKFNPIDVTDFLANGPSEREWLIGSLIGKGTTMVLVADGGVGKSLLGYDICKAIATGQHWNGYPTQQGKVLIVQTDEPEIDTRERLDIARFGEIPKGTVSIINDWQFSQIKQLEKWIEKERPAFVMIDSLSSANRTADEDEKDSSYAYPLYDLRDIANSYGCSIVVLHHENKAGLSRGTTAIKNAVSEMWRLRRGEKVEALTPNQRILEIVKTRSVDFSAIKIELNVEDYSWQHQGEFGDYTLDKGKLPLSARVLQYLQSSRGVRFEPEELTHEFAGSTRDAIRMALERMRKKGLVLSEERLKHRDNGAVRYKVYYCPLLNRSADTQIQAPSDIELLNAPQELLNASEIPSSSVQRLDTTQQGDSRAAEQQNSIDAINVETLPPVGQKVTISSGSENMDGKVAIVKEYSNEPDGIYCAVVIETECEYKGYKLHYKPEHLLW